MKKRGLSGDETALWRRAVRDVRPLRPGGPRPPGLAFGETTRDTAFPLGRSRLPVEAPRTRASSTPPPAIAAGDPAAVRRARRGRLPVEARLDLHGLTVAAARVAFGAFLERAARDGKRCVLVITGKGAGAAPASPLERAPRGVIRRSFLEWIDAPALRPLIARVARAAPHDGGDGAFYVILKSRAKS